MATATRAREWLAAQDGPRTSRQMADGIGGDVLKVQFAVGVMLRDGLLRRVRATRPCTYAVAREAMTREEVAQVALNGRLRSAASRTAEQEVARRAAAEARRIERERTSAARKRQRVLQRREYDRKRYEAQRGAVRRYVAILESQPVQQTPAIHVQTVEEWLAMGGQVERLDSTVMKTGSIR